MREVVVRVSTLGVKLIYSHTGFVASLKGKKMTFTADTAKALVYEFAENSEAVSKKDMRTLLQAMENEVTMADYVYKWYTERSKDVSTNKEGKEVKHYSYPHATEITNCRSSKDIVVAYYKAYDVALDGFSHDDSEDYQTIHENILVALGKYFVTAFISCIEEQYGDAFVEFYCARIDYLQAEASFGAAKKKVRGLNQSITRLSNPKNGEPDAEKVAAKQAELEEAEKAEKEAEKAFEKAEKAYQKLCGM